MTSNHTPTAAERAAQFRVPTRDELLALIEQHCRETGETEAAFSERAFGHRLFVTNLRHSGKLSMISLGRALRTLGEPPTTISRSAKAARQRAEILEALDRGENVKALAHRLGITTNALYVSVSRARRVEHA